jgi:two-component system, OmpR family, response regulator
MGIMKILVAEDNLNHQKLARETLEDSGYEVVTVADGLQALDAVRKEPFDLVVLDIRMPGMDGLDFIKTVRRERGEHSDIPIIVVSGYGLRQHQRDFKMAGISHVLSKPYDCDHLIEKIKRYEH